MCHRGDRGGGSWTGGVERTRWCRALAPRYRHLTMWVSAADPGVSQFLHRSNGDIVVDAIGFVVRATLKEHTGSPVVGTLRCSPGAWHAAARRAHGGVGHNQDRREAASKGSGFDGTGGAASAVGPEALHGPIVLHFGTGPDHRPLSIRAGDVSQCGTKVVSLPALSCLCAVVPSCCLSPAATTPASRPTRLRWLSAPHRYWRLSPSRQSPSSIVNYRLLVYETVRDRFPGLRGGQPVRIGRRDGLLTGMDGIRVASCAGGE